MNNKGSSIIEFIIIALPIGLTFLFSVLLLNETIDRAHIRTALFETAREIVLRQKKNTNIKDIQALLKKNLIIKGLNYKISYIDNSKKTIIKLIYEKHSFWLKEELELCKQ